MSKDRRIWALVTIDDADAIDIIRRESE